ncbi:hypothetical protein OIU76_013297 [Salix suchowensis]|uniref:Uncharacterized protein n=4 Tax=Salix TaxID=40685 RepID=A0A9Q0UBK3_SALPP|nr:hypothetical protein IMY05_008G0049900 [Salix suchowensis]KAJ6429213.1 hypothetical protein OIU84_020775 [Salix udensis]KAJ6726985.1 hypothetical protein OIU79_005007 [Salix purpurea]KAJ6768087.1 hypothetical protein OIU74_021869 [Salix koriyanagi]KAJ6317726.1 hypothetical protein OIU76_013297 [Salix suchowensis]
MNAPNQLLASVLLLLVVFDISQYPRAMEARPLALQRAGNSKMFFASLGLECKCCDAASGECRSSWDSSCPKLKCHPWKSH